MKLFLTIWFTARKEEIWWVRALYRWGTRGGTEESTVGKVGKSGLQDQLAGGSHLAFGGCRRTHTHRCAVANKRRAQYTLYLLVA